MTDAATTNAPTDTTAPAQPPELSEAEYEAAFNAQVAKMEAGEKDPEPDPAPDAPDPDPAPAPEPVAATPAVVPDDDLLGLVPADKRDALAQRLKAAAETEARAKKLEQDNRSMAGRMSAYQRRYEEAAGKRPTAAPAAPAPEQSEEWKQFAENYPDIAKAIEARTAPAAAGTDPKVADAVEYVEAERRNRYLQDAYEAVEAVHAGWKDVARSKDFQDWKATSPTYEKLAASDDVADAIALFDLYGAFRSKSAAPAPDPKAVAAAASVAARRGAQAEGARTPTNRATAPNQSVDLNDEDQLFAYYAQKSNARLKSRYN